jgi:hypothetical protein
LAGGLLVALGVVPGSPERGGQHLPPTGAGYPRRGRAWPRRWPYTAANASRASRYTWVHWNQANVGSYSDRALHWGRGRREKVTGETGLDSPFRAGLCHPHPATSETKECTSKPLFIYFAWDIIVTRKQHACLGEKKSSGNARAYSDCNCR